MREWLRRWWCLHFHRYTPPVGWWYDVPGSVRWKDGGADAHTMTRRCSRCGLRWLEVWDEGERERPRILPAP